MSRDEPILDALPAEQTEGTAAPDLPFAPEVRKLTRGHRVAHLTPRQQTVFALFVRSCQEYHEDKFVVILGFLFMPILAVVGIAITLLFMLCAYGVLYAVSWGTGPGVLDLLYLAPVIAVILGRGLKSAAEDRDIDLHRTEGLIVYFDLGRLSEFFNIASLATLTLFLGTCIGFQVSLLYWTPGHAGLPIEGTFWQCSLLTLDNICHGVFLDTFELYDIHIGPRIEHTFLSATVFYAFRLSFDALVVFVLYAIYQRYRLRRFFWGFPHEPRHLDNLLEWLDGCAYQDALFRKFLDEMTFLLLVREYLRGNYVFVEQLTQQIPWLKIKPEVRALFRDPEGKVLFAE